MISYDALYILWFRLEDYFFSVYENTLLELGFLVSMSVIFFVGRHIYLNRKLFKERSMISLVIGGWGTRGKSGSERLKSALLNAIGLRVLSKTTGCEAMFLYGNAYGPLYELNLFRPYDKATIWEQYEFTQLANKLQVDVLLWECMALDENNVKLLQQKWMKDDIATITNAFPDHENVQGPAGINVAEVIASFIPANSVLLTAEEQMLPVLKTRAHQLNTRLRSVNWLAGGLLTQDVLERFPYQEHPDNIALVLALADELGIEKDFALKEMADRMIPDIGALKTYPAALMRSRRLEFSNGMSANERYGCLSNWTRLGFSEQDILKEPGVWITTVVNNRADRVARSHVFSNILVKDISADRHFIVGSNVTGFMRYVEESWQKFVQKIMLCPEHEEVLVEDVAETLKHFAFQFRMPITEHIIIERLRVMLQGQNISEVLDGYLKNFNNPLVLAEQLKTDNVSYAESIVQYLEQDLEIYHKIQNFLSRVNSATESAKKLNHAFRHILTEWFLKKFIVVKDVYATGDQIIERICEATPPGFYNRIMGIQNIKGIGLGIVHCFQSWDMCFQICKQFYNHNPFAFEETFQAFALFKAYNLLCEEFVRETIQKIRAMPIIQQERFQAELTVIQSSLDTSLSQIREKIEIISKSPVWLEKVIRSIEAFLDIGDAVKRRKKANQIYEDLSTTRISYPTAIRELQGLNARQEGGWLYNQFCKFLNLYLK
jgi:poly-gamma-glutamate synthase PgsB/CapB